MIHDEQVAFVRNEVGHSCSRPHSLVEFHRYVSFEAFFGNSGVLFNFCKFVRNVGCLCDGTVVARIQDTGCVFRWKSMISGTVYDQDIVIRVDMCYHEVPMSGLVVKPGETFFHILHHACSRS